MAAAGGPVRFRPAARGSGRRSVAPSADPIGRGGTGPRPARWSHPGRTGPAAGAAARSIASVRDRLPTRAPSRAPCRSVRPRRRSRACRAHPSGDPRHGADAVRSLHGAGALRPRWWLLPLRRGTPGPRRRLHHGARAPSDLRRDAGACGRRRLGDPRSTRAVQRRGARCRRGCAGRADARARCRRRSATTPSRSTSAGSPTLRERLADAGLGERLVASLPSPFDGVILANEVLDALPVHRVRQRGDDLRELAVDVGADDRFVEVEIDPTTSALAERLAIEGIQLRRRPDRRDRACARRLGPRGGGAAPARTADPHRLWCPGRRAVRPGPASRRHAAGVRSAPTRRRSVSVRRPPGPDRSRRRDRGRTRRRSCRPRRPSGSRRRRRR